MEFIEDHPRRRDIFSHGDSCLALSPLPLSLVRSSVRQFVHRLASSFIRRRSIALIVGERNNQKRISRGALHGSLIPFPFLSLSLARTSLPLSQLLYEMQAPIDLDNDL